MGDKTRRPTPDERVPPNLPDLLSSTFSNAQNTNTVKAHTLANATKDYLDPVLAYLPSTYLAALTPPGPIIIPSLIEALDMGHNTFNRMLETLLDN